MKRTAVILGAILIVAIMTVVYFINKQSDTHKYENETHSHESVMQQPPEGNKRECIGKISFGTSSYLQPQNNFVFPNFHELEQENLSYWREKVSDKIEFLKSEPRFTGYDEEHGWSKDFNLYLRYYLFDEFGLPMMFATVINCSVDDDMNVYIANRQYVHGDKVENVKTLEALQIFPMLHDFTKRVEDQENESYAQYLLRKGKVDDLETSDGAIEKILKLSGGNITEKIPKENDRMYVVYAFKDGSHANIELYKLGKYYIPAWITNDENVEKGRNVKKYVENVTVDDLKKVTKSYYDNNGVTQEVYELSDNFIKLAEIEGQDAVIYGLYGCNAMVIRIGDLVSPIWQGWDSYGIEFASRDYDFDGTLEYSYSICEGHGTGYSKYGINVVEVNGDNIEIHHFDDVNEKLKQVTYEFDKENQQVNWLVNGQNIGTSSISSTMEKDDGELKWVSLTDIQHFSLINGDIELQVAPGILCENNAAPIFDDEINLLAHVKYSKDGTFALENFRISNKNLR